MKYQNEILENLRASAEAPSRIEFGKMTDAQLEKRIQKAKEDYGDGRVKLDYLSGIWARINVPLDASFKKTIENKYRIYYLLERDKLRDSDITYELSFDSFENGKSIFTRPIQVGLEKYDSIEAARLDFFRAALDFAVGYGLVGAL